MNDDLNNFDDFGGGQVSPMDKHKDLLKGLTEFKLYLRTLYNNWVGLVWDEEEKKFIRNQNIPQIMNTVGANWHVSFIETYVRQNNILSHLNRDEYWSLLEDINRTLLLTYASKYHEFGFKNRSDVIRVWNELENASLLALSGAGGGKYSEFLGGGIVQYRASDTNISPNSSHISPASRKGFFGRTMDWLSGSGKRGGEFQ